MDVFCSSGAVTPASDGVEDSSWGALHRWADARAGAVLEYLGRAAGERLTTRTFSEGHRNESVYGRLALANGEDVELPEAERLGVFTVRAWLGFYAVGSVPYVSAVFTAAFQVVKVTPGAEPNPPPASVDKSVDEDTASPPDALTCNTGRSLTLEIIT